MDHAGSPFLARKDRPLVVGHRGVPRLHQENTLAGFRRAVELGVPAVELDVLVTRDRRAVCLHDASLERLTGVRANVRDLTWDEVSALRVRRELPVGIGADGAPAVMRYEREEPIPLLSEVLSEIAPRAAINIEVKLDYDRWWSVEVGAIVAREVMAAGAQQRVIVSSFDPRKLRAVARVAREVVTAFCFDDGMLDFAAPLLTRFPGLSRELVARMQGARMGGRVDAAVPGAGALADAAPRRQARATQEVLTQLLDADLAGRLLGTRVVGAEHTLIGEHTVARLHARGVAVGTHTLFPLGSTTGKPIDPSATSEAEVERLVAAGIDWIETDDPERLLALL